MGRDMYLQICEIKKENSMCAEIILAFKTVHAHLTLIVLVADTASPLGAMIDI